MNLAHTTSRKDFRSMQKQNKRDREEECIDIFILVHPNLGLHSVMSLQHEIFTNTTSSQLDQQPLDFITLPVPPLNFKPSLC